jgi:putative nucleotidyltransferase with HDIG domain
MENEKINSAFLYQLINVTSKIVGVSDAYTALHQHNVSVIARLIAQEMNLSAFEVEGIRVAGQLHDIGKSAIPNELLSKFGVLNFEELELLKSHAKRSCEILSNVDFPWPIKEMVIQHHERMDGSGYPEGISGDDICIGARILAVSDIADAMMNARPYRKALGLDAVIVELTENQFLYDPVVCNAFMTITSDGGQRLADELSHEPKHCPR